jgi:hypothetical protein
MIVRNNDRGTTEERNERIELEKLTENDTSIVSSFVHGDVTTSGYDGRPSSPSFLHFNSFSNATANLQTPNTFCDSTLQLFSL